MRNTKHIALLILVIICLSGCERFEDYQNNPNETSQGDPGLLLTNIEVNAFNGAVTLQAALSSRQMVYTYGTSSYQYYNWTRAGFGNYSGLRQVVKLEEEANKTDDGNNYLAIAKFFKAYYFFQLTNTFGDIPFDDALLALEGVDTPVYTPQEDVFEGILQLLEEANDELLVGGGVLKGDLIYGGDITQWKKAVNSFRLRVLLSLSKKEDDGFEVASQFAAIVNNPSKYPLITSNNDNLALPYFNIEGNEYPYFNNNDIKSGGYYLDASFVTLLQEKQDPRLFTFADMKPSATSQQETDYTAYGGLDGSAELSTNTQQASNGEASPIDARYYSDPVNEPGVVIGYAETQFILAEATQRGWINGDASSFYETGIIASMQFYNIENTSIETYLAQPEVAYVAQNGIEQIITQKYIASFMNSGFEVFYNNRRTGFPAFKTDGGGVFNDERIPKRWMYPQREIDYNAANLNEAIDRQYPEGDDINAVMWLIQ